MDYVITTYQTGTPPAEFCPSENPAGNWYWNLNDGNLPVGQFPTETEAYEDAIQRLKFYRDVMRGTVSSIAHVKAG